MMKNGFNVNLKLNNYVNKQLDANHFVNIVIENVKKKNILYQLNLIIVIQLVIN